MIKERLGRAERSGAIQTAGVHWATRPSGERPHLPNGLATRLAGAGEAMYVVPEPAELIERAQAVVEAAGWFPRRGHDLGIAFGEDPDYGPNIRDWLLNVILDLRRAGLADQAVLVAEALGSVEPELQPVFDADLGVALAEVGRGEDARAKIAANLAAWPDDFWVRVHAGDALEFLGDPGGARAHFEAARSMADRPADFEERAVAVEDCSSSAAKSVWQAAGRRSSVSSESARPAVPSANALGSLPWLGLSEFRSGQDELDLLAALPRPICPADGYCPHIPAAPRRGETGRVAG